MMAPTPVAAYWLLGTVAASYAMVPVFLRGLKINEPNEFAKLGSPKFGNIFSRTLSDWKFQRIFFWFLLSGQAIRIAHGWFRLIAVVTSLAYCGMAISWICLAYAAFQHG